MSQTKEQLCAELENIKARLEKPTPEGEDPKDVWLDLKLVVSKMRALGL